MRAVAANPLQATPWVPAYYDQLDYKSPHPPPPSGPPARQFLVTSRGTLSATAIGHVAWSPASITGLGLWLDASSLALANGAAVSSWGDKSTAGRHAVDPANGVDTPPTYRAAGLNGKPAVEWMQGQHRLKIPGWGTALSGKTQYTLFIVAQMAQSNYGVIFCAPVNTDFKWLIGLYPGIGAYWGHGTLWTSDANIALNTPYRMTFSHDNGGTTSKAYLDGADWAGTGSLSSAVPDVAGDVLMGHYYYGRVDDAAVAFIGAIAEVIWYDHALTTPERAQVEAYLVDKWLEIPPVARFDWHEGSGSTTTSTIGGYTLSYAGGGAAFVAGGTRGTWDGAVGPAGALTSWSAVFESTHNGWNGGIDNFGHHTPGNLPWLNFNSSGLPGPWPPDQFGSVPITLGARTTTAWVFTPTETKVYVNGVLSGTFGSSYAVDFSAAWLLNASGDFVMHTARLYNVALTAAQVAAI